MVTDIIIPVKGQLHFTQSIVEQLKPMLGWNHCWIMNNGDDKETKDYLNQLPYKFTPVPSLGESIYEMWNKGWKRYSRFADHVLFLNNDITLHPATIVALNNALDVNESNWLSYPDYNWRDQNGMLNLCNFRETKGTYRHGGMSGYCFMLKRYPISWSPLVDTNFKWWCGDDDIAFNVEKHGGKQVRIIGLPIEHENEGTARHYDLGAQKAIDMKRCIEKWGR